VYAANQSNKAQKQAANQSADQGRTAERLQNELISRQDEQVKGAESEAANTTARDEAKRRQRQRSVGATGRRDTILTSPLGLVGQASATGKTLLGQ
jgi:hypothetical protein